MQRLRHLERPDLARGAVHRALLDEETAVEQHSHRLDGVQGHALGAVEDLVADILGQTRHEAREQLAHHAARERLEVERAEVAMPGAPGRTALGQLGAGEREHEERAAARPFEQVLDEVQQARVGPLHVLEDEHGRVRLREPLEEQAPGREQVLLVACSLLGEAEELREARLDVVALAGVEQVLVERCTQLAEGRGGLLVLRDPAPHPDHVRERPVGDALAVGEAATAMPVDVPRDPVEVLVELPAET